MENLKELISTRDETEKKLKENELLIQPLIDLKYDRELIDKEGFPRADLDFGKLQQFRNLKRQQNGTLRDI